MKTIAQIYLFFLLSYSLSLCSEDMPSISETDVSGCIITRSEIFDGNSLWGYINGGADVYLEYGFDKLLVQEAVIRSYKITINIYRMKSPEAAFGIYSINKYKCISTDSSIIYSCITKYQFQFANSEYYVSVVNRSGTPEEQSYCSEISHLIFSKINPLQFNIPEVFQKEEICNVKFFKGILGLQNGYPDWIEMFEKYSSFSMYLYEYEKGVTAFISFKSASESEEFITYIISKNEEPDKGSGVFNVTRAENNSVLLNVHL